MESDSIKLSEALILIKNKDSQKANTALIYASQLSETAEWNTARIIILYYSRTGNTEKMAKAVAEGAKTIKGIEVELAYYVRSEELHSFDAVAVGVPTCHHDASIDIKKLFEEAALKNVNLKGRIGATFGSYGWSGEAPRLIAEIMRNKFEMQMIGPPLLIKYAPDQAGLEKCKEFGKMIAEKLMHAE